jgi:hypothetical protein
LRETYSVEVTLDVGLADHDREHVPAAHRGQLRPVG